MVKNLIFLRPEDAPQKPNMSFIELDPSKIAIIQT